MAVIKFTPQPIKCSGVLLKVVHDPGSDMATLRISGADFGQLDITLAGRNLDRVINDLTACQIAGELDAAEARDLAVSA